MVDFDVSGLEEMREALLSAVKKYPDKAQEALENVGKVFKRDVAKETYRAVEKRTGNLVKGYKLDRVEGFGSGMRIHFYAEGKKNPHFHLIERGHKLVTPKTRKGKVLKNGGRNVGFVTGRLILDKVKRDYDKKLTKEVTEELDCLLKECGLI